MADYGLRITNGNGVYTLTPDDRITRIIGSVNTGTADGSYQDDDLSTGGHAFYFLVPQFKSGQRFSNIAVDIAVPSISWTFQEPAYAVNYMIYYGLY